MIRAYRSPDDAEATFAVFQAAVRETAAAVYRPDGRTRTYRLYLPTQRADDAPLVLALHGGTGNGEQLAQTSGYDGLAEANGFVVAYPEGTPTALGPRQLVWNAGGCRSWYLDEHGVNRTIWPGFTFEYWARTRRVDPRAYELIH